MPSDRSLRIAHLSIHSCVRSHKIALSTADRGNKVYLLAEQLYPGQHAWWAYDMAVKLYRRDGVIQPFSIENAVINLDPLVDVWHVHNEPDWTVKLVRNHSEKPIIWDVHDMRSKREGHSNTEEEDALKICSAVSVVSKGYQEEIIRRDPLKKVVEILSCVPAEFYPKEKQKIFRGGIVYEGGLGSKRNSGEFPCRRWSDVMHDILEMGIQVWAYPGNPDVDKAVFNGVLLQPTTEYVKMIQELSMYEFGLIGSPTPDPMFDGALPNKLFEYMAAGIPMINMNAPDVERFLLATGMGVTVRSAKEIPDAMQYMRDHDYRKRVWNNRWNWTFDSQIDKVLNLYESVL